MTSIFALAVTACGAFFKAKSALVLENRALRQQLAIYKRDRMHPRLRSTDRVFWVSAEVTPSESSRWADSPEVAEEFPVFGFGEFWGAVSQQSNYWVVPPAGAEKSAGVRGVHV